MPLTSAVDDVYQYLLAQGAFGGVTGWDGLKRRMMDSPAKDQCVVIQEDGGEVSEMAVAEGLGSAALSNPGVLVTVRAAQWDSDASLAKANEIKALLHSQRDVTLVAGGSVYFGIRAMTPEPIFAGYDDVGRPLHTIAFRLLTAT